MLRRDFLKLAGISLAGIMTFRSGFLNKVYAENNFIFETNIMEMLGERERELC